VSTKAQDILIYEGLYKVTKMVDEFYEGLKSVGILKLIRAFPEEFCRLFTYTGLSADEVIEKVLLHSDVEKEPEVELVISFFKRYIRSCNEEGE